MRTIHAYDLVSSEEEGLAIDDDSAEDLKEDLDTDFDDSDDWDDDDYDDDDWA